MDAEEFIVDDGRDRKVVEQVHHLVINLLVVLGDALGPEVEK